MNQKTEREQETNNPKENIKKIIPVLKKENTNNKSNLDALVSKENKTNDEIKEILKEYFECSKIHTDIVRNSVVDEYSYYLNIKKNKIIEYLRSIGGKKYKCSAIQGHREIKIKKNISEQIKLQKIK